MISLKQSYEIEYDGTENCARMDLFADSAADLTGLTHYDNIKLLQGSDALDISTGYHWIMQSGGSWIRQPASGGGGGGDTYTREEIDEFLADKQDLLTWASETAKDGTDAMTSGAIWNSVWTQILGVNTTKNLSQDVPETGYDCNTLTDPGIYRVPSAAVAADIANIPTQAAGRLIVSNLGLGNRYIQIYLASGARVFIRSYVSTGWQAWYEYQGIENLSSYSWLENNLRFIQNKEINIKGSFIIYDSMPKAIAVLENGYLDLEPMVTHRLGLEDIARGVDLMKSGEGMEIIIEIAKEEN